MDNLTFTIDTSELDNTDFNQLTNDIQAFINILHHASPDFTTVGIILQKQLDEQVKKHKEEADPRATKLAISKLPRTITKLDLFEEAQRRFQKWVDMYADSSTSIEQMYDDMSCSSYSGDPAFDFPNDVKIMQEVK